ncbi:MAG: sugar phosphate nucleotidyltransferase [Candidatus Gracilibacteria bacterium]|jgi:mannose-1-phosphate guanylyltransferase
MKTHPKNLKIVILAGGAGTRLWPMSSRKKPKQFQRLISNKTLLEETYERISFVDKKDIFVSTAAEYGPIVKQLLPCLPHGNLILEPSRQDTAPSIGLAATLISKVDPAAVMAIIYADHLIRDPKELEQKLYTAAYLAEEEHTLNIIEVKAKYPNTNLGYVRIGKMLKEMDGNEIYEFKEFKEKPDLKTAKRFLSSYSYLWNTGYYVWRVSDILAEFEHHLPATYQALKKIGKGGEIDSYYKKCDKISIDYGIMEKVDPSCVRIIPADLGWSDIGTFASLHEELAEDPSANVINGKASAVECEGCLIYNESKEEIAAFGLNKTAIISAGGKILICPLNRSGELKTLLKELKNED